MPKIHPLEIERIKTALKSKYSLRQRSGSFVEGEIGFIALTQDKFSLVDKKYFDLINSVKWSAVKSKNTFYAIHGNLRMHSILLNPQNNMQTDHINGNGLDNRMVNLRSCTQQQNHYNMNIIKNIGKSKYRGINWYKRTSRWFAKVRKDRKTYYFGTAYKSEEEAARAYDRGAKLLYGEFARLNFPQAADEFYREKK